MLEAISPTDDILGTKVQPNKAHSMTQAFLVKCHRRGGVCVLRMLLVCISFYLQVYLFFCCSFTVSLYVSVSLGFPSSFSSLILFSKVAYIFVRIYKFPCLNFLVHCHPTSPAQGVVLFKEREGDKISEQSQHN